MNDLERYCKEEILPYMTRKTLNMKHTAYGLKHLVESEIGRYVSQDELQQVLLTFGYPVNDFYPISQKFYKEYVKRKLQRRRDGYCDRKYE